jgi:hypothetical protein
MKAAALAHDMTRDTLERHRTGFRDAVEEGKIIVHIAMSNDDDESPSRLTTHNTTVIHSLRSGRCEL